ncbi:LysM peptidoglycan-binding domain-containing protein [Leuconostoc citreum]|uniref:LysM peptidoglycan-binding domain-containing protein n=1 Tax=Leuconostoc citreum TaxID=33964 RepID=UPI0032DFCFBF
MTQLTQSHRFGDVVFALGSLLVYSLITVSDVSANSWIANTPTQVKQQMAAHYDVKTGYYILQYGDTIHAIAIASQLSANELVQANQIKDANIIYAGSPLRLNVGSHQDEDRALNQSQNEQAGQQQTTMKTANLVSEFEGQPLNKVAP